MVKTLSKTVDYLSENLDGVNVKFAYEYNYLDRPVIKSSIYVTVDETKVNETVSFAVYVYTPVVQGGIGCMRVAERVVDLLQKCKSLRFSELTLKRLNYNSNSNAFIIEIKGNVFDENDNLSDSKTVSVLAFNFSENRDLKLSFSVPTVIVNSDYQPYAIKSICSSVPIDIINTGTVYKIIFENISTNVAKFFWGNGSFSLKIKSGSDIKIYDSCFLNADRYNMASTEKIDAFEISAYVRKGED